MKSEKGDERHANEHDLSRFFVARRPKAKFDSECHFETRSVSLWHFMMSLLGERSLLASSPRRIGSLKATKLLSSVAGIAAERPMPFGVVVLPEFPTAGVRLNEYRYCRDSKRGNSRCGG